MKSKRIKRFIAKCELQKNPVRLILHEKGGKRYLTVVRTSFMGAKWARRFEIVSEVDAGNRPIEFKGVKIGD